MTEEKEVLDDEFNKSNEINEGQLTSGIYLRAVIYFFIMFIAGIVYNIFGFAQFEINAILVLATLSLVFIGQCLVVSFVLEVFGFIFRKYKFKKTGIKVKTDPFWFQVVEGGFSIWILIASLLLIFLLYTNWFV